MNMKYTKNNHRETKTKSKKEVSGKEKKTKFTSRCKEKKIWKNRLKK